jgi:hypothetical protein
VAEPIVVTSFYSSDPDVYWFNILLSDASSIWPVPLGPTSVVTIERQIGGGWSSGFVIQVALNPDGQYSIRTVIPPSVANGSERIIRLTIDGVVYGPWSFRFEAP